MNVEIQDEVITYRQAVGGKLDRLNYTYPIIVDPFENLNFASQAML